MVDKIHPQRKHDPKDLICCRECRNFHFFENGAKHNSPHALGECRDKSWDGSRGQWAMFQHHCGAFETAQNRS
ncbi:MAG: hypothetical protein J7M20_00290 [Deltaproteobacteria bacterium]|nr:hypothetical protein [Deltaproteobacteria bacterium]